MAERIRSMCGPRTSRERRKFKSQSDCGQMRHLQPRNCRFKVKGCPARLGTQQRPNDRRSPLLPFPLQAHQAADKPSSHAAPCGRSLSLDSLFRIWNTHKVTSALFEAVCFCNFFSEHFLAGTYASGTYYAIVSLLGSLTQGGRRTRRWLYNPKPLQGCRSLCGAYRGQQRTAGSVNLVNAGSLVIPS